MTQKDLDRLARVLKAARRPDWPQEAFPEIPSAEWMRQRIVRAIAAEYTRGIRKDCDAFCKAAGVDNMPAR